ncbi:MAG: SsrA-binding protein SmpB [Nitrospirota bacterium]
MKIVATNKKAYHDYHIEESYEAGMLLKGTEVKSLREGRANLKDSFARVDNEEIFLYNCHISPYSHGNIANHDPLRTRKLLMHKGEIQRLMGKMMQKGYTLLPLKIYFKDGKAKIELALAKGKKQYDKREDIKKRDAAREMEKAFKEGRR